MRQNQIYNYFYINYTMKYLKEFVIGSCAFISLPNFYSVYNNRATFHHDNREYLYYKFTIESPIRFGLWNVGSLIVSEIFGLSPFVRFFTTAIIHWISTIIYVKYNNLYSYSKKGWYGYYFKLLIFYIIIWNIVIYNLNKYI